MTRLDLTEENFRKICLLHEKSYVITRVGNITEERMTSSGILRRVPLTRTDVSEKYSASIIRVTRIDELGAMLAVTSNRRTLQRNRRLLVTPNVIPSSLILVSLII
jgi:hypothetical protein